MEKMIQLSPQFFLLENVPGITGKRGKEILKHAHLTGIMLCGKSEFDIHTRMVFEEKSI